MIVVRAIFDPDAGVWCSESSDIHGLRLEADSLEALMARIPGAIQDLLEGAEGHDGLPYDIPVEIIANAHTRVRRDAA